MRRAGYIGVVGIAIVVVAAGLAFVFGTPQAPPSPAAVSPLPSAAAEGRAAPSTDRSPSGDVRSFVGEVVTDGEVPPPDPDSPFTFQIPGCRCHSDDPVLVEEHAGYRLNQCRGCHSGT